MYLFSSEDLKKIGYNLSICILTTIAAFLLEIIILAYLNRIQSKKNQLSKSWINLEESKKDIWIFAGNMLLNFFLYDGLYVAGLSLLTKYQFFHIPTHFYTFPIALAVVDLSYYWMHRWEHANPWGWAIHGVHHSCKQIKFSAAVRVSWFFRVYAWVALIPAVALGFHPVLAYVCYKFILLYQIILHNEYVGKLGFLEKIFITPSHHRVHHGMEDKYLDKNFATIFIFWDKLFGTFQTEEEKPTYGAYGFPQTKNPFVLVFEPLYRTYKKYFYREKYV